MKVIYLILHKQQFRVIIQCACDFTLSPEQYRVIVLYVQFSTNLYNTSINNQLYDFCLGMFNYVVNFHISSIVKKRVLEIYGLLFICTLLKSTQLCKARYMFILRERMHELEAVTFWDLLIKNINLYFNILIFSHNVYIIFTCLAFTSKLHTLVCF